MLLRVLEHALGGLDPQSLQIVQRLVAGSGLEAPHEVADAHAVVAGDVLETELVGEVVFQPLLDLQDRRVMVQLLSAEADTPWGVAALYFVEGIPGHRLGHRSAAETLDQIDVEVAGGGDAAGAEQVVGIGQVLLLVEQHVREAFGEFSIEAPVGGSFLAIQQTCLGQPEDPGRLAAEGGSSAWLRRNQGTICG